MISLQPASTRKEGVQMLSSVNDNYVSCTLWLHARAHAHLACCLVVAELAQEEDLLHALLMVEVQIEDPE
jgi:hypothetical protein